MTTVGFPGPRGSHSDAAAAVLAPDLTSVELRQHARSFPRFIRQLLIKKVRRRVTKAVAENEARERISENAFVGGA